MNYEGFSVVTRYPAISVNVTDDDNNTCYHTFGWVYACHYFSAENKDRVVIDFVVHNKYSNDYYGEAFASSRISIPVNNLVIYDRNADTLSAASIDKKIEIIDEMTRLLMVSSDEEARSEFFG